MADRIKVVCELATGDFVEAHCAECLDWQPDAGGRDAADDGFCETLAQMTSRKFACSAFREKVKP